MNVRRFKNTSTDPGNPTSMVPRADTDCPNE
jgi:hypothetical protein